MRLSSSSSRTESTSEAFRWEAVIGAKPPSSTVKMSPTTEDKSYQNVLLKSPNGWHYPYEVGHSQWRLRTELLAASEMNPPVVSEGGWLSTGSTMIWRSYTGRLCLCWGIPLLLTLRSPSQHRAGFSVPPSDITKVIVSWRGVSPISSPETTTTKDF